MPPPGPAAPAVSNLARDPARPRIRALVQDMPAESIADLAIRARQIGGVIPLWYGEGDLVTPEFVRAAAKTALDEGMTFYIPDMHGLPALTEALARYQTALHGVPIGVERSTVTPGGMQALLLALDLILDPGQNVIYVEPQWPNIHNLIHLRGGEPRPVPLRFADNDWSLDLDRIAAACDARTRAIVFSSPANPTGWVANRAELQALLDFARTRGIWIIADEVYARLYFDAPAAPSILQVAEPEDLVLTVNSFSKAWAMTGWRVGWLVHPPSVAGEVAAMTQFMNSGTAGVLQAGALAALEQGESLVATMRGRCATGLDMAYDMLSRLPDVRLPRKPRGGMYAFFSLASGTGSREAARRILEDARVGLAPGHLFGASAGTHLRMCICRDPAQLEDALGRIVAAG